MTDFDTQSAIEFWEASISRKEAAAFAGCSEAELLGVDPPPFYLMADGERRFTRGDLYRWRFQRRVPSIPLREPDPAQGLPQHRNSNPPGARRSKPRPQATENTLLAT
jgi:hypothetical protein